MGDHPGHCGWGVPPMHTRALRVAGSGASVGCCSGPCATSGQEKEGALVGLPGSLHGGAAWYNARREPQAGAAACGGEQGRAPLKFHLHAASCVLGSGALIYTSTHHPLIAGSCSPHFGSMGCSWWSLLQVDALPSSLAHGTQPFCSRAAVPVTGERGWLGGRHWGSALGRVPKYKFTSGAILPKSDSEA